MTVNDKGLVPVIAQDAATREVLMLAWADQEALARTLADGTVWYWSRSRNEYWHKGSSSGNQQTLREARLDCDGDAVLLLVDQSGPACHTGQRSCFHRELGEDNLAEISWGPGGGTAFLAQLTALIAERARSGGEQSYVASLLRSPDPTRALQKVGEEAVEFILAASVAAQESGQRQVVIGEAADLVFHLLVALESQRIGLPEVIAELRTRHHSTSRAQRETSPATGT